MMRMAAIMLGCFVGLFFYRDDVHSAFEAQPPKFHGFAMDIYCRAIMRVKRDE
jgi:hypothetical protein